MFCIKSNSDSSVIAPQRFLTNSIEEIKQEMKYSIFMTEKSELLNDNMDYSSRLTVDV